VRQLSNLVVGIDATNLRRGGGVTHLIELLRVAQPKTFGIERVVVWGGGATLLAIDNHDWLDKRNPPVLNEGLLKRALWQRCLLSRVARDACCDVLFVPGGSFAGDFHPVVTMSRNLLPFEIHELLRYGWSMVTLKMLLLRLIQMRSYKKADGVIFLTEYARNAVLSVTGKVRGKICTIPHGLNPRFNISPKIQRSITEYDEAHPFHVLYVSTIDQYKHQWHVLEAVATLRSQGLPIVLDLVGSSYPPALKRLNDSISRTDPDRSWVHCHGAIPFKELHHHYARADLGLFASSCENMPNVLLETMASGLPIACSRMGPMPEVLHDTGVYFNPEQPETIASALRKLIDSPQLRAELSQASHQRAQQFSWQRCADQTFSFLGTVTRQHK
jgi:glycosyltransferase involved in cell wall biosynthesis